jgi:hypothetical protein
MAAMLIGAVAPNSEVRLPRQRDQQIKQPDCLGPFQFGTVAPLEGTPPCVVSSFLRDPYQ